MLMSSGFSIEDWISEQKIKFGNRDGLDEHLAKVASRFDSNLMGLSGSVIDSLLNQHPRMIPYQAWGGSLGWRSSKRLKRWLYLLERDKIPYAGNHNGLLIRFAINPVHWVPHPYCPPAFCLLDKQHFFSYITKSDQAWDVCQKWRQENTYHLNQAIKQRLRLHPLHVSSSYRCYNNTDCAEVAFWSAERIDDIKLKPVWKQENSMACLLADYFSDVNREYAPSWLNGQRIDVYIPSINVGFEYQGEQHHRAVDCFGGEFGLAKTKERDERKQRLCRENGIKLIEWQYYERFSKEVLLSKLMENGISLPE